MGVDWQDRGDLFRVVYDIGENEPEHKTCYLLLKGPADIAYAAEVMQQILDDLRKQSDTRHFIRSIELVEGMVYLQKHPLFS